MKARSVVLALVGMFVAGDLAFTQEGGYSIPKGPCGSAEPAHEQRRKGGEGIAPLPLPGTPQRRTERKRQPAPPPLIVKLEVGAVKEIQNNGQAVRYYDWDKDPGDIPVLLNQAQEQLNVRYTYKRGPILAFDPDPAKFPIFYLSASDAFLLTQPEVEQLRTFLRNGGMIWGDTCFGDPEFFKSFVEQMTRVLPDRHFYKLPMHHALFHCFQDITEVQYTIANPDAAEGTGEPQFYGMDLGCRTAILLSRYGLSCGWDGHIREGAMLVHPNDARRLGLNMISYALAMTRLAQYQSTVKEFFQKDQHERGDFVFAQAEVGENWDTQANGIANLLKTVATKTSAGVKFSHQSVNVGKAELQNYPFVYMTGHYDFVLSDAEVANLKKYIKSGGFVFASPCCGTKEFDVAFRREIARVLPGNELKALAEDHPAYTILNKIEAVQYNDFMRNTGQMGPALPLEGITIGAVTPVIYCSYGIGGGWRGFDHPYARDIASEDALKLGVNIVLYSMTH